MPEHELEKLLGGFAADTLTTEEKQQLYRAALQDQQLFNALADEQALKELLADPDVRRRLLASLDQKSSSGAGGPLSWLDRFRHPAGLAFAGGLAAAALAVVLGIRIYQDSLKQATQSVATEDTKPTAPPGSVTPPLPPPAAEPEIRAKDKGTTLSQAPVKEAVRDDFPKKDQTAKLSAPKEQAMKRPTRETGPARLEAGESRRQDSALPAPSTQMMEKTTAVTDEQPQASSAASPAVTPKPQSPATFSHAGAVASGPGARALFYGTAIEPAAAGQQSGSGLMAEAPLREKKQSERRTGVLGKLEIAKQSVQRPLGIRYTLMMTGPGGIDMEVDPATPVGKDDGPRLAVQTSEDGYLSVLYPQQSSDRPAVLFPSSGDGRITGRQPVAISLDNVFDVPQTAEQIRLLIMFSRTPFDVGSPLPANKTAPRLLIEQVDPGQPGAPAEQAVYVVNPDPGSPAYLLIEVLLSLRP